MSTIYSCNKKLLRAAGRAYAREYNTTATVPFCMDTWYSEEGLAALKRQHADWFLDCRWLVNCETDWFVPHCAWCYEERWLEDDNEHEECDIRLHYYSEIGKAEQAALLTKVVIPLAPAAVIAQIMAFL